MKTKNLFIGKSRLVALLLSSTILLTSCANDDDNETDSIEEIEAVETIENSLKMDSNGMAKSVESTMVYAEEYALYSDEPELNCGQNYSDSFSESYSNSEYSYNYFAACNYILNCDSNGNPLSLDYTATRQGDYETPRMSSDDEVSANWTITNLDSSSSTTSFNGSYARLGSQISKVRNLNTFNSTLNYALSNVTVNKQTYTITSGTAAVSFVGTTSSGNQYTYNGTVTFNGDNTATLVINGNSYTIYL